MKVSSKNKLFVLGISIIGILLITMGIIKVISNNLQKIIPTKEPLNYNFTYEELCTIKMCENKNCSLPNTELVTIKTDIKIKEIQDKIDQINRQSKQVCEFVNNSTTNKSGCEKAKKEFKHSNYFTTEYSIYENDEILSIAVYRINSNLCTETIETLPYDIFIYDKLKEKTVSQKELLGKLGYTDETITKRILQDMAGISETPGSQYSVEAALFEGKVKYNIYINNNGEAILAFQIKNKQSFDYAKTNLGKI